MYRRNISRRGMKRRRANSSPDQNKRLLREKVNIPDDTWLESLKFLTCPQWSEKRFVGHQINGIVQRNISRLPKMVLDSVAMYYIYTARGELFKKMPVDNYTVVVFYTVLKEKQSTAWFKDRGFSLEAPADIPAANALVGIREWKSVGMNVNVCIFGTAQDEIPLSKKEKNLPWFRNLLHTAEFRKPVSFYAQFNPVLNQYSWAYLAQFLKCVYHPTSYIKQVQMCAVNQNFIDLLKCNIDCVDNEPRYIRCISFTLKGLWFAAAQNDIHLSDSLKWVARNVRAETIHIHALCSNDTFVLLNNFLLDPSGAKQCARNKMYMCVSDHVDFLNILIKKFHTTPLVEGTVPTINLSFYLRAPDVRTPAHLGPNLIDKEVDSQGADELYMISNGQNRMRISFRWVNYLPSECNVRIYSI